MRCCCCCCLSSGEKKVISSGIEMTNRSIYLAFDFSLFNLEKNGFEVNQSANIIIDSQMERKKDSLFLSEMGNSKSSPALSDPSEHRYEPSRPTDSRSPCPALNVLANHGYLPRDGKNIPADLLQRVVQVGVFSSICSICSSSLRRSEWVSVG